LVKFLKTFKTRAVKAQLGVALNYSVIATAGFLMPFLVVFLHAYYF